MIANLKKADNAKTFNIFKIPFSSVKLKFDFNETLGKL